MATKRVLDGGCDSDTTKPQPKRAKTRDSKTRQHQSSDMDPTWGQKYVFSSIGNATTIPQGEESDFEDDTDAMAYLMSVRHQASTIPHLLVAPKVQIGPQLPAGFDNELSGSEEGELDESTDAISTTDSKGFYEDGAYIGVSEGWENDQRYDETEDDNEEKVKEACFASLREQYNRLRGILNCNLPVDAERRLSESQHTEAGAFGHDSSTTRVWASLIRTSNPHPIQVALMSKDTVIRILRVIIGGKFLRSGYNISERTSQWLWALLARLPEQGELNHAEIGWVRDLGRRAVLLSQSLVEMAALREDLAESGFGISDNVDVDNIDEIVLEAFESEDEGINPQQPEAEADAEVEANADAEAENPSKSAAEASTSSVNGKVKADENVQDDVEDGEVCEAEHHSDQEDVAMDIASDSDADEGEIKETAEEEAAALEEAKNKLLAKLAEADDDQCQEEERLRARMNMRATLTMILTIAGEYYGQRDLLAFREPFIGM